LRPVLALVAARALGYSGRQHIALAAIVEFIHTATLLHDDVVDDSDMRRGQQTANLVWGDGASVLVGDFLYSRAFQMMVDVDNMRVMEILANATNTIAAGEVMQLANCHDPDTTEERYLSIIAAKTAMLFEAAARLGAVLCKSDSAIEQAMAEFGRRLGIAYQLIDDVLDYGGDPATLGKCIGDDLAEGKPTLPLLYALWHSDDVTADHIRAAIRDGGREHIDLIRAAIESTGAIAHTASRAKAESAMALAALAAIPPSPYRDALQALAEFSVNRSS
jgi:octaprenyl-diphosphate synthase